jgi:hypothetical protein
VFVRGAGEQLADVLQQVLQWNVRDKVADEFARRDRGSDDAVAAACVP